MSSYVLPILAIVFLVEIVLRSRWYPPYFTRGILVFRTSRPVATFAHGAELPDTLANRFRASFGPSLLFHRLPSGEIAFREPAFELKLFSYTPVMHGLLRLSEQDRVVEVEGRANWFVLALSAFFVFLAAGFPEGWALLIFAGLILGYIYSIQVRVYGKVADSVAQGAPPTATSPAARSTVVWLLAIVLLLLWAGGAWYWFNN
jgi:hypothetical protein